MGDPNLPQTHYSLARELIQQAGDINNDLASNPRAPHISEGMNKGMRVLVEIAQVHATLAIADRIDELDSTLRTLYETLREVRHG